ncbi:MFS transporter [Arthrobacter sp. FW306-04-A]|uniref:MFS transporter n=1 Tax=Arthrobacter sp. FW306-04-A TaxID=2879619 RepID=UPI0037C19CC2|nr:MFS transporter [Arthrobacter sp. FW306-04-A]
MRSKKSWKAVPARTKQGASPWAPFRHRAFLWLWLGVVAASIGSWGQTVGAQWLFVTDPNASAIVPLVQTANQLPVMLLALPAGVLADAFDRRWLLFGIQTYFVVVASSLAILTALGMMPPALLLAFTFAVGCGAAMLQPVWQSLIAEIVPRDKLAAATRLDMVSVNVSRAAGPALAGLVIAHLGVPPVFVINAAAGCTLAIVLLAWRRPRVARGERERFLPALRAGTRYVRHEPVIRRILLRFAIFVSPACAVWALLPLIANRQLGVGPDGYGLLFASMGVGALIAAFNLGKVKQYLSSNAVLVLAAVAYALTFGALAFATSIWLAVPLLVVYGFGWTATVATTNSELQLFLPGWVRARGIAIYVMVFLGTQALSAAIWGLVTQYFGLQFSVLAAAALVACSAFTGRLLAVQEAQHMDRSPLSYWRTPEVAVEPDPAAGPVLISVEYEVADDEETAFLLALQELRRSRLRSGASRWDLYRVGESPKVFLEQFEVPTWREHQRQHEGRLTAQDKAIEDAAFAHVIGTPRTQHLLPPSTPRLAMSIGSDPDLLALPEATI